MNAHFVTLILCITSFYLEATPCLVGFYICLVGSFVGALKFRRNEDYEQEKQYREEFEVRAPSSSQT